MAHSSYRWLSEVFVMQDPPAHTRLRKLVAFALTPKRVAAMQPRIQQIVDGLLDAMLAKGEIELLWDFAYQLPTLVMCDMLGLEGEERSPASLAQLTRAVAESFIGSRPARSNRSCSRRPTRRWISSTISSAGSTTASAPGRRTT